jgi:hypothetical protein
MTPTRRTFATVALVLFAVGGVWFFGDRLPRDVTLWLELPPSALDARGVRVAREDLGRLEGSVTGADGAVVATFSARAGASPLGGPVALRLRDGLCEVRVALPDQPGARPLLGRLEVDGGGEVRVDLRAAVP